MRPCARVATISVCPLAPECQGRPVSLPACRPQDDSGVHQPAVAAALVRLLQGAEGAEDPEGMQGLLQVDCCSAVSGLRARAVVTPDSWPQVLRWTGDAGICMLSEA